MEDNNNNNGGKMNHIKQMEETLKECQQMIAETIAMRERWEEDLEIFQEIGDEESIEEVTLNLIHAATFLEEMQLHFEKGKMILDGFYNDEFNNIMKGME